MLFTSYNFVGFLILLVTLYYIIPKKFGWVLLLIGSYVFYFFAGLFYPLFLFFTTLTTYLIARKMDDIKDQQKYYISFHRDELTRDERKEYNKQMKNKRKRWMILCLLINFGILAVLKYTNFAIDNINSILGTFHSSKELDALDIILPMGISFYTFQSMAYLIDVYWEKVSAQRNFFKFALFVSFFPQLIQGPISRYNDLSKTLFERHSFAWENIKNGLIRVMWGYFKKLIIADRIIAAVKSLIESPDYYSGVFVLLLIVFYGIELYADFTGGIDITIGIAQMLGIKVTENFERPFFSKNIAEYWRRWHITMGTWFKDYVFYPLSISGWMKKITSFSKGHFGKGAAKRVPIYIATMITWFATGIWHGANWNFIVWGLMNGMVILISQELNPLYERFSLRFPRLANSRGFDGFRVIRTFLLMGSLRLFDCYRDVKTSFVMFFTMFTQFNPFEVTKKELLDLGLSMTDYTIVFGGVLVMFTYSMLSRSGSVREKLNKKPFILRYAIYISLIYAVLLLGAYSIGYDANQFIYNQF